MLSPDLYFAASPSVVLANEKVTVSRQRAALTAAFQVHSFANPEQISQVAAQHVRIGDAESAIRLLLSTPNDQTELFRANGMQACLLAACSSPQHFSYTVKFVARNMIAVGNVDGGVGLLTMVGRHQDAVRYLQVNDRWEEAARLAKASPDACAILSSHCH